MRQLHFLFLIPLALGASAAEAQHPTRKPLVFAVSEGTSGGIDADAARVKYQPLADVLGRAIGSEVKVAFFREFSALEKGMKENQFDFVLARPSDYPARGLRDYHYKFVATAKPDGQCILIVHKDSPIRKVAELKGKTFVMPEKNAYMTRFCRAELRDQGIILDNEAVTYVREQGAIPFSIENRISDVGGIASYSGAYAQWLKSGNRALHQSKAAAVHAASRLTGHHCRAGCQDAGSADRLGGFRKRQSSAEAGWHHWLHDHRGKPAAQTAGVAWCLIPGLLDTGGAEDKKAR